eukprot:6147990-Amphidinium_carterae.1
MPKAKAMANHSSGTTLAKARRVRSPTLTIRQWGRQVQMPTMSSRGIPPQTMATLMVPTIGHQIPVNNGTTWTTVKEQDTINNIQIHN